MHLACGTTEQRHPHTGTPRPCWWARLVIGTSSVSLTFGARGSGPLSVGLLQLATALSGCDGGALAFTERSGRTTPTSPGGPSPRAIQANGAHFCASLSTDANQSVIAVTSSRRRRVREREISRRGGSTSTASVGLRLSHT
jgi:hypothetical protein